MTGVKPRLFLRLKKTLRRLGSPPDQPRPAPPERPAPAGDWHDLLQRAEAADRAGRLAQVERALNRLDCAVFAAENPARNRPATAPALAF